MQSFWLLFLLMLTAVDLLFFEVRFTTVALLFVILRIQADSAAKRFLKAEQEKRERPEPPRDYFAEMEIPEPVVASIHRKKENARYETALQAAPAPIKEQTQKPKEKAPKAAAKPKDNILYPNFKGRPHEVLGIEENAATRMIVKAFHKWIHKFHPDHSPAQAKENATLHTRQLAEAKEALLERRKRNKRA
jgi:hypothetical protein